MESWASDTGILMPALEGFDDAILGVAYRSGEWFIVYDTHAMLARLEAQGMTHAEAVEYFEFNIAGSYLGESTPGFLHKLEDRRVH